MVTGKKKVPPLEDFAAFGIIDTVEQIPSHVRIVLIQDGDTGDVFWKLPGGKCEAGELWHITARREIKEELDLDLDIRPEDLFSHSRVEGAHPHEFVTFVHRAPHLKLEEIHLGKGIKDAKIFDERESVRLLLSNRVLTKYITPVQDYLVERRVLLR